MGGLKFLIEKKFNKILRDDLATTPSTRQPSCIPYTQKPIPFPQVGIDGRKRRADEQDRKHPPGVPTCSDVQRAAETVDEETDKFKGCEYLGPRVCYYKSARIICQRSISDFTTV